MGELFVPAFTGAVIWRLDIWGESLAKWELKPPGRSRVSLSSLDGFPCVKGDRIWNAIRNPETSRQGSHGQAMCPAG